MTGIVYFGFTVRLPLVPIESLWQTVALQQCRGDHDYEKGLRNLWQAHTDLVVVEHDIRATQAHINDLLACPAILCAYAYSVYPVTTGLKEPRIAHCNRGETDFEWISEGEEWADHAAFGLTKLGKLARQEVTTWDAKEGDAEGTWRNLDTRVSRALNEAGLRFHIHWPEVEHDHQ